MRPLVRSIRSVLYPLAGLLALAQASDEAHAAGPFDAIVGVFDTIDGALSQRAGFRFEPDLTSEFDVLSRDIAAALIPPVGPLAMPLAPGQIRIGVNGGVTRTEDADLWAVATDKPRSHLTVPRLEIRAGLPWGLSAAAYYSQSTGTPARYYGGDVALAIAQWESGWLRGVHARASYGHLSGLDGVEMHNIGGDLIAVSAVGPIRPFAAVGVVSMRARLDREPDYTSNAVLPRLSAGLATQLGRFSMTIEGGIVDERPFGGFGFGFTFF